MQYGGGTSGIAVTVLAAHGDGVEDVGDVGVLAEIERGQVGRFCDVGVAPDAIFAQITRLIGNNTAGRRVWTSEMVGPIWIVIATALDEGFERCCVRR